MTTSSSPDSPIDLAVLISGGGTTLKNLIEQIDQGFLNAKIQVVISSRSDAPGLIIAENAKLPHHLCHRFDYPCTPTFSQALFERLAPYKIDLVCLGGFLDLWKIPDCYRGRVMNIHPALLPAFGGKGFYGLHVHQAVLQAGIPITGCTVHFCDDKYDQGPIILQQTVPVIPDDSPESLQRRVFEAECEAYPEAIRLFQLGRLSIETRKVIIQ